MSAKRTGYEEFEEQFVLQIFADGNISIRGFRYLTPNELKQIAEYFHRAAKKLRDYEHKSNGPDVYREWWT